MDEVFVKNVFNHFSTIMSLQYAILVAPDFDEKNQEQIQLLNSEFLNFGKWLFSEDYWKYSRISKEVYEKVSDAYVVLGRLDRIKNPAEKLISFKKLLKTEYKSFVEICKEVIAEPTPDGRIKNEYEPTIFKELDRLETLDVKEGLKSFWYRLDEQAYQFIKNKHFDLFFKDEGNDMYTISYIYNSFDKVVRDEDQITIYVRSINQIINIYERSVIVKQDNKTIVRGNGNTANSGGDQAVNNTQWSLINIGIVSIGFIITFGLAWFWVF